jgi:hypothetical protein
MAIVFLGGPFNADTAWQRVQNIRRAEEVALEIWKMGLVCVCPHANSGNLFGALPEQVFLDGYKEILARCDVIFLMEGWEKSAGSVSEKYFAKDRSILIFYALDDLKEWIHGQKEVEPEE